MKGGPTGKVKKATGKKELIEDREEGGELLYDIVMDDTTAKGVEKTLTSYNKSGKGDTTYGGGQKGKIRGGGEGESISADVCNKIGLTSPPPGRDFTARPQLPGDMAELKGKGSKKKGLGTPPHKTKQQKGMRGNIYIIKGGSQGSGEKDTGGYRGKGAFTGIRPNRES